MSPTNAAIFALSLLSIGLIPMFVKLIVLTIWTILKLMFEALKVLVPVIFRALAWLFRGLKMIVIFGWLLFDEWRAGPRVFEGEDEGDDDDGDDDQAAHAVALDRALVCLGLTSGCSREELERAYRAAMRTAHPDRGGSHEAARELNVARDLIKTACGWN